MPTSTLLYPSAPALPARLPVGLASLGLGDSIDPRAKIEATRTTASAKR
jgi:hypothetical protein